MAVHGGSECPRLKPRQIRTAAIVQNIVRYSFLAEPTSLELIRSHPRYYAKKPQTATSANVKDFPPQNACTSPTTSAVSESTCTSTTNTSTPTLDLPQNASALPHDPTLTAFAQLATLRLDCERGFISLIDHKHQYLLAEATRSVSLQNRDQSLPGDGLWIGPMKLDLKFGICPETIHIFDAEDEKLNVSSENLTANQRCYVINDLSATDCFKDRPYVSGWPFIRFYAEVPLKLDGYIIGSVCVVDSRPGNGVDVAALDRLAEVASAVACHLELVQAQNQLQRSQEMVRGLGRFVDGKSVREWWKDTFNDQFRKFSDVNENPSEQETGFAKTLSTASEHKLAVSPTLLSPDKRSVASSNDHGEADEDKFDSLVVTATNTSRSHTNDGLPVRPPGHTFQLEVRERLSPPEPDSVGPSIGTTSSEDPLQRESASYEAMQHLFSRASHLIAESCDLDGVIFFDASLQDIAVTHNQRKSQITPENTRRFGGLQDSSMGGANSFSLDMKRNSSVITPSTDPSATIRHGSKADVDPPGSGGSPPICHLLGYSLRSEEGHSGSAPLNGHLYVPQSTLRSLLHKYPSGHIFLFNSDGSLLEDEEMDPKTHGTRKDRGKSVSNGKTVFEKKKEQLRAYHLLDICPGARAIIFFPLWDPQRDQVSIAVRE
jgi:hypothetical protein